jgi:hypothetical protein
MPEVKISFKAKPTVSLGRNGIVTTTGVEVWPHRDNVTIYPVTSKGKRGRCYIEIPAEALPELTRALQRLQSQY